MFEINEGDLPFVRTKQALLILDLQNDFVSPDCHLPVDKPPEYVERILELVPTFRKTGIVFWIRSQFEESRPINQPSANVERVITDKQLPQGDSNIGGSSIGRTLKTPQKMLDLYGQIMAAKDGDLDDLDDLDENTEEEEAYDSETFLTLQNGQPPRIAIPMTAGNNFTPGAAKAIDATKDVVFVKSHYSAFKSGTFLQTLRGQFVTELFICGALTNISIFATVMEAAQYGFQITLVDDCLGYRSKARHDEARRQLIEAAGCEVMESSDVVQMINVKITTTQNRPTDRRRGRETQNPRNLHDLMAGLKLKNENGPPRSNGRTISNSAKTQGPATNVEPLVADESPELIPSTSEESLPPLPPPKRPENAERKRVPNKIKTRRRRSDSTTADSENTDSNTKNGDAKEGKKPLSPTHVTLSGASEVLKSVTSKDPNTGVAVANSTTKKPDLDVLLEVDSPRSSSKMREFVESRVKSKSPVPRIAKAIHIRTPELPATEGNKGAAKKEKARTEAESKEMSVGTPDSRRPSSGSDSSDTPSQDTYHICGGDSMIIHNLLPRQDAEDIFERVRDEVRWQKMSHQGGEVPRLVAVQGEIGSDGSIPIYRHPADESPPLLPFSPNVSLIKASVEQKLGHAVNHCLIQFYRSGTDYISEHSDKTLDIAPNTFIANISLGAMRAMTFRTKKPLKNPSAPNANNDENAPRMSCKAPLPHNSMCKMSLLTNEKWLHSIRPDKRLAREKSEAELAFNGCRISLTFRLIGTFLSATQTEIWGQGAVAKSKKESRPVVNGETAEAEKMLQAFGRENHSSIFDWHDTYGAGFDVLHISNSKKLFLSGDKIRDLRVRLALAARGFEYVEGKLSPAFSWKDGNPNTDDVPEIPEILPIRFVDNDSAKSEVEGDLAVLLYLDAISTSVPLEHSLSHSYTQLLAARKFTRLHQADQLLQQWRAKPVNLLRFRKLLAVWKGYAAENKFIAGPEVGIVDWAFWPVLKEVMGHMDDMESTALREYHERLSSLEAAKKVFAEIGKKDE